MKIPSGATPECNLSAIEEKKIHLCNMVHSLDNHIRTHQNSMKIT